VDCNPTVAGFDSQARLHGRWSSGTGRLPPKEQARSSRAGPTVVLTLLTQLTMVLATALFGLATAIRDRDRADLYRFAEGGAGELECVGAGRTGQPLLDRTVCAGRSRGRGTVTSQKDDGQNRRRCGASRA
jgi:hypothetical protein